MAQVRILRLPKLLWNVLIWKLVTLSSLKKYIDKNLYLLMFQLQASMYFLYIWMYCYIEGKVASPKAWCSSHSLLIFHLTSIPIPTFKTYFFNAVQALFLMEENKCILSTQYFGHLIFCEVQNFHIFHILLFRGCCLAWIESSEAL